MTDLAATKIDGYSHIAPPQYTEALRKDYPKIHERAMGVPTIGPTPPLESFATPKHAAELARVANDEMAELVEKYPESFVAGIALLPMNDIEAAIGEAERAVKELGLRGIYMHSNINGKPLDSPEFLPLFELMAAYDLPV